MILFRFLKITNMFSVNRDSNDNEVSPVDFKKNVSSLNPFTGKEIKAAEKGLFVSTGSGLFSRDTTEPPASIFSRKVETVGNLMQERKTVDWSKAKINISKETMEVVEMECKMNPEYSEKYSKLD